MRCKNDEDKEAEIIAHLDGYAFELHCETFSDDGQLNDDVKEFYKVNKALANKFKVEDDPKENIRSTVEAGMEP